MSNVVKIGGTDEAPEVVKSKLATVKPVEPVAIELNGKTYNLVYDMNAFAEIEQHYGTIDIALNKVSTPSFNDMRFFLWAGLLHDTAEVDEDGNFVKYGIAEYTVGRSLTPADLQNISASIWKAIRRDLQADAPSDVDGKKE